MLSDAFKIRLGFSLTEIYSINSGEYPCRHTGDRSSIPCQGVFLNSVRSQGPIHEDAVWFPC